MTDEHFNDELQKAKAEGDYEALFRLGRRSIRKGRPGDGLVAYATIIEENNQNNSMQVVRKATDEYLRFAGLESLLNRLPSIGLPTPMGPRVPMWAGRCRSELYDLREVQSPPHSYSLRRVTGDVRSPRGRLCDISLRHDGSEMTWSITVGDLGYFTLSEVQDRRFQEFLHYGTEDLPVQISVDVLGEYENNQQE